MFIMFLPSTVPICSYADPDKHKDPSVIKAIRSFFTFISG